MNELFAICNKFKFLGETLEVFPYGKGLINKTYKVVTSKENYLLQEMNINIFHNPEDIISNIIKVTNHIKNKGYKSLTLIESVDGKYFVKDGTRYFRAYFFIENAKTFISPISNHALELVSYYYGRFVTILNDFDALKLNNIIPNFHNTLYRYEALVNSIKEDKYNRVKDCKDEIEYLLSNKDYYSLIIDKLKNKELPYRVTHNDTKIDNILVDYDDELLAVIDFDTLMPGSLLYDFGDLTRSSLLSSMKDNNISLKTFECLVRGYYHATKNIITKEEVSLLSLSSFIITLELAMRFLGDYLDGDKYFSSKYDGHNLDRCKKQISLARAIFVNLDNMNNIVNKICTNR